MTGRRVRVTIEEHPTARPIERAVAAFANVDERDVVLDARCDDCGRPHGKPRVVLPRASDGSEIVVSKSSAAGLVATAVSDARGDLGVDIESLVSMSRARVDEVAFSDAERDLLDDAPEASRAELRTRLWSRKEAYLKATGRGLRLDLTTVDLASEDLPDAVIVDVPLAEPTVILSVAMLGREPVTVELVDPISGGAPEAAR